jgi:hypothetical protein
VAVSLILYGKTPINLMGGETGAETKKIDWISDTHKAALFTATYSPAQDTDELYSGLTNEVANGNGYTTGGNAFTGTPTAVYTGASNLSTFDVGDPAVWTASGAGFSFRYVVLYDSTTDVLIGYLDYGSTVALSGTNGDTFTLTLDAAGMFTATVP